MKTKTTPTMTTAQKIAAAWDARGRLADGSTWWWMHESQAIWQLPIGRHPFEDGCVEIGINLTDGFVGMTDAEIFQQIADSAGSIYGDDGPDEDPRVVGYP